MSKRDMIIIDDVESHWCARCKDYFPSDNFTGHGTKSGVQVRCKDCRRELNALMVGDGFFTCYELVGGHVGSTKSQATRWRVHKSVGRDATNPKILMSNIKTKEEARFREALYQLRSPNYSRPDRCKHIKHLLSDEAYKKLCAIKRRPRNDRTL